MPFKENSEGQTNYCIHWTDNPSGICNKCFGKKVCGECQFELGNGHAQTCSKYVLRPPYLPSKWVEGDDGQTCDIPEGYVSPKPEESGWRMDFEKSFRKIMTEKHLYSYYSHMVGFIEDLEVSTRGQAYNEGRIQGVAEEAARCAGHVREAREELVEEITNLPFASHAVEGNRLAKFVRLEDIVELII